MKQKLDDLNIKITELAFYLNISRPTLYSLIDKYENKQYSSIDDKYLALFNYIEQESFLTKQKVIAYLIKHNQLIDENNKQVDLTDFLDSIIQNKVKKEFILNLINSKELDHVIRYLNDCLILLKNHKVLSKEQIEFLKPLIVLFKSQGYRLLIRRQKNNE